MSDEAAEDEGQAGAPGLGLRMNEGAGGEEKKSVPWSPRHLPGAMACTLTPASEPPTGLAGTQISGAQPRGSDS